MIEFSEVKDTNSIEFDKALCIYAESIPASERQSTETIKERVSAGTEKLFVGVINGGVALMALLYPLEGTEFVLLDYMAVKEEHRKRGLGSEYLRNIYEIAGLKNKLLGGDRETRQRRVYFYRKNGARILKNIRYMLPPLQGSNPTEMILMVISRNRRLLWLSGDAVEEAIVQIYRELYGRSETDPMLAATMSSIEPRITLQ